jgi:hypothetical protein
MYLKTQRPVEIFTRATRIEQPSMIVGERKNGQRKNVNREPLLDSA